MKRIKQEQHIEIEEKSQQLKIRMQTEIQINKHHALCQASDQLEELDYLHTGRSAEPLLNFAGRGNFAARCTHT